MGFPCNQLHRLKMLRLLLWIHLMIKPILCRLFLLKSVNEGVSLLSISERQTKFFL